MRTLVMFLYGTAPEIRDSAGNCAEDKDFLILLNAHYQRVAFRISYELYHSGWKIVLDTARPDLPVEEQSVGRNRLVDLTERSFVVLSHDR
jgi:hypothetical protein